MNVQLRSRDHRRRPLAPVGSSILTDLYGYWKLDEASGTRFDSVNTSHLTDNNTVTQAAGKIGSAASFDEANAEYLSVATNPNIETGDISYTWSAWVWGDATTVAPNVADARAFIGKFASADGEFLVYYAPNSGCFRMRHLGGGGVTILSAIAFGPMVASTWYHVLAWRDKGAGTINMQINNSAVISTASARTPTDLTSSLYIGNAPLANWYWHGRVDEVGFWKRVLTASERTRLYNGGAGKTYPFT